MKVTVAGGAGFIGSHIQNKLIEGGHEVTVVDNLSRGFAELVNPKAKFVEADIADQEKMTQALSGQEAVIHLANYIVVPESVERPVDYAENNVVNTVKLLEAMRAARVQKLIFSSSATVYGETKNLPIKETDPLGFANNPYGASKVAMEQFSATYQKNWGMDTSILRYFNPFGPNENHEPETHAVPNFIKSTLQKQPIPLYWKGEQVRDFIYVEDLAAAHVRALELEGLHVLNVGTGQGTKVADLVKQIFSIVGYEVPISDLGPRPGDAAATYASADLIKQTLGWQAETSLAEGLKKTIEYFRARLAPPST
jgi:UDP-glucose 4-epimerase